MSDEPNKREIVVTIHVNQIVIHYGIWGDESDEDPFSRWLEGKLRENPGGI